MNLQQIEQVLLSAILVDRGAIGVARPELTADKFVYGPAEEFSDVHRMIYRAMVKVKGRVDTVSVAAQLDDVDKVGGMSYLQYLATACLPQLGIRSTEGLPQWIRIVDAGGRIKQLGDLIEEYSTLYSDFTALLERVEDVDVFIADFQAKISMIALGGASTQYKHISVASSAYRRILEDEGRGIVLTYYPIGWPSFENYGLPPQSSLMVLSGLSTIGKSQLMLQMALGIAIQLKHEELPGCVVINNYEMSGWRCSRRLASCLAGVDYQGAAVRREGSSAYNSMMTALEYVDTLPIFYDDTDMSSDQIALQTMKMSAEYGQILFLGVDYAELVNDREKSGSEELRVSKVFRNGQKLARSTGMCACILSQVSDASMYPSGIVPYNKLRYSRGATNAADVICYLYNPIQMRLSKIPFVFEESLGEDSFAYVIVQKNRDGRIGAFPMAWTPEFVRFEDIALDSFGQHTLYRNLHIVADDF